MPPVPEFGQADLSNCDREPIHLAGSVQPHGALVVLREPGLDVVQASANCGAVLGLAPSALLGRPAAVLGDALAAEVVRLAASGPLEEPVVLRVPAGAPAGDGYAAVHRVPGAGLVVEFEPAEGPAGADAPHLDGEVLAAGLAGAVQRFGAAASASALFDAVVQSFRELTGYDRVMVYRFDPDGHGKVVAEARDPRLESLLGHQYPSSDIPQQARLLYLRNRVRMLADVDYAPQPLEPARLPHTGEPLDMSMCHLRSMSPLHLQYLRNMGVTATLTASLVHEGRLWGLVALHHYAPRHLHHPLRAAADLLAEVASTRIAAIENYAHAQVALMVRRLEQRLVEATSTEGDWRAALFRNARLLLQPLEATGAVLFQGGEVMTSGDVPSSPELRALLDWVREQPDQQRPIATSALGKAAPALASLAPTASGVLAVRLSAQPADYLVWLRKEQLQSVTWAGDPHKPKLGDDPSQLSPRRSFAAWSEIVRGTAVPWTDAELALAAAFGGALADLIVQVNAVRLLIAQQQLAQVRASVAGAREPVVVADSDGRVLFANDAFTALRGAGATPGAPVAALFADSAAVAQAMAGLGAGAPRWQRALDLAAAGGQTLPVSVRVELVASRGGPQLGFILVFADQRETRRAEAARERLESSLRRSAGSSRRASDEVVAAILTHASLAAMDIADVRGGTPTAPLLEALEASTQRAATLYQQIRDFLD